MQTVSNVGDVSEDKDTTVGRWNDTCQKYMVQRQVMQRGDVIVSVNGVSREVHLPCGLEDGHSLHKMFLEILQATGGKELFFIVYRST